MPCKKKFLRFNQEKKLEAVEEEIEEKKEEKQEQFLGYFSLALEFGFVISFPIAGGALFGQYLDRILGTGPRLTLSLIFLGIMIAALNIYSIIKDSR